MKKFLYLITFVSGMSVMAVELCASRLLAPYFGTSLFVWTNVIGIILVALAVGYAVGGWLSERSPKIRSLLWVILAASLTLFAIPLLSPLLAKVSFENTFIEGSTSVPIFAGSFLASLALFFLPVALLGMVSPMILKLLSLETAKMGEASGRVFAIGTAGSFIGTFIPVLVTIPTIGTRNTILLFAGALFLIAAGGLMNKRRVLLVMVPLLAFHQANIGLAETTPGEIARMDSPYQFFRVVEREGARYLVFNEGGGVQSEYRPDTISYPGTYYDAAAGLPSLVTKPGHAVILGLAGGTLAHTWHSLYGDHLQIDGVEIDPAVTKAAQKYFALDETRVNVIQNDGRMQLQNSKKTYDLIYVDAYSHQFYIPFHLATREFFDLAKTRLAPGGVLAMNVNSSSYDAPILASMVTTLKEVFPDVRVAQVPGGFGWNWLLIAGNELHPENLAVPTFAPTSLKETAEQLSNQLVPYAGGGGMVLTDDRAPIEQMTDAMFWGYYKRILK